MNVYRGCECDRRRRRPLYAPHDKGTGIYTLCYYYITIIHSITHICMTIYTCKVMYKVRHTFVYSYTFVHTI